MANPIVTQVRVPSPFGGISHQAAHLRHVNQVEDAENALFSVIDGMSKRPGTNFISLVGSLSASGDYRIHPIDRDGSEQYLVVYGEGELRVFTPAGVEVPVIWDTDAASYFASGSPDSGDIRMVSILDYTIILNSLVSTASKRSTAYDVTESHYDYDEMVSQTPAAGTYHRTRNPTAVHTAGYHLYDASNGTFPTLTFDTAAGSWNLASEFWATAAYNPSGFKISFQRVAMAISSGTIGADGVTLTKAGAFVAYSWQAGDQIQLTGGTNVTTGWYTIASRTDDDTIVLSSDCTTDSSSHADVTTDGIGIEIEVVVNFDAEPETTMRAIASRIQQAMWDAGARDALCQWVVDTADDGHMVITGPWRGAGTEVNIPTPPDTAFDLTVATRPFDDAGTTAVAGTGSPATQRLDIDDRWSRVAPPDQEDAEFDATTMPVQMTRQVAPYYADQIIEDGPFAYWRLGDASGTTATDEIGNNNGTYVGSPTLGVTGPLTSDTDTAVTFDGSTQYATVGTLGSFGSGLLANGFTIEAWIKLTDTGTNCVFGVEDADNGGTGRQECSLYVYDGVGTDAHLWLRIQEFGGGDYVYVKTDARQTILDGEWHHIVGTMDISGQDGVLYIDGAAVASTASVTGSAPTDFYDYIAQTMIGAFNPTGGGTDPTNFFAGTLDEVAIYLGQLTADQVEEHYLRGTKSALFYIQTITWKPRYTGSKDTNPSPSIITDGRPIADISMHRNRLVLAGDERIVFSQVADLFNFYIDDYENIVDSDPIDVGLSSDQVTLVDYIVPFRETLAIFTKAGRQFELNAPESLTPNTVAITPSTSYQTLSVRPVPVANMLYFVASEPDATVLYEYFYDDAQVSNVAYDVSAHAMDLLPSDARTIAASTNNNTVLVIGEDDATIYVYRYWWRGNQKEQSSWSKYTFDASYRISDIAIIANYCYALVESNGQFMFEKLPLSKVDASTGWPYYANLDRRQELTGTFDGTYTNWELGFDDTTIDTVVLGPDFTTPGTVVTVAAKPTDDSVVRVAGDYTDGEVHAGRSYAFDVELSQVYRRGYQGVSDFAQWVNVIDITTIHHKTGTYNVIASMDNRVDRTRTFSAGVTPQERGILRSSLHGDAEQMTISITSTSPMPVTICGINFTIEIGTRV